LPDKGEKLFITGGEKDVMSLAAQGFDAISLNSETASLDKSIADELKLRFNHIIVLYDNDATGIKQSEILSVTHGFHKITLPAIPNNGKDISDYFATGGSLKDFIQLLSASLQAPPPEALNPDKVVFNAVELMATGNLEPQYLMSPIFPQKGTAVLAGKPDTGKSQFARQLCIHVAFGLKSFIDFELNPIHNRSIYVATEDNADNTRYLMNRQMNGLGQTVKENLRFIFADTMEQEEILKSLDEELTIAPADLVVVDSFGDIFKGGDSNNNMAMRNTVKTFDKIAKKHNCLILFVHHINKGAYRQAPGQEHIQGGAGLMQKVRLGIQLSEGDNNTRYFTVVKGNNCPKEYKQNSIVLDFSEDTFIFQNTGKLIPTNELGTQPNEDKKEEKYNELESIAEEIFGDQLVSYSNFVKRFCEITGKSIPTAKRAHTNLKKLEIIVEANGSYRWANHSNDEFSEEETDETPF
jgi:KaiC/GvpD/RAD55 family RecA-like ATPase